MPPSSHATRPAASRWLVAGLIAQVALGLLAMTICLPSMQAWPALFDASQAEVQLTFAGFAASYGVLQLVHGALSDRLGRKPVLLVGLGLAAAASLLAALSTALWVLVLARLLQGAGCAAGMVIGRAMVQDLFDGAARTRVMAYLGMSMGLCPPLALVVGGAIDVRLGWKANFVVIAIAAVALLVTAWRVLPDVAGRPRSAAGTVGNASAASASSEAATSTLAAVLAGYGALLRVPTFGLYLTIVAMTTAAFYTYLGATPIVLAAYGVTPDRVGFYVMVPPLSYILGNLLTTRLLRRGQDDRRLMLIGQASTLVGILLVMALALAGVRAPLAVTAPLMLMGIGHGLLLPPALAGTVGLAPALAGSAAAVAGLMQQVLGALGGFAVGLLPLQDPFWMAVAMLLWSGAGALATLRLVGRRKAGQALA